LSSDDYSVILVVNQLRVGATRLGNQAVVIRHRDVQGCGGRLNDLPLLKRIRILNSLLIRALAAAVSLAAMSGSLAPVQASHFRYGHYTWDKNAGGPTAVDFEVPHMPDKVGSNGPEYFGVPGSSDGVAVDFANVAFLESGGIRMIDPAGKVYAFGGEPLFYGTAVDPKFVAFRGDLTSMVSGQKVGRFFVASVPEPASWALLVLGFGAMGGILRLRRPVVS
jgi:hypothetical protein